MHGKSEDSVIDGNQVMNMTVNDQESIKRIKES